MSRRRILLVEDETNIARGLVYNLETEGYAVTHVESGEEAVELCRSQTFAMVVLDIMLPGIDGYQVCDRLRSWDPRLPILMLTARSEEADRVKGLSKGADDYLTKPFSLTEFLLRVQGILRRSEWYRPSAADGGEVRFGSNRVMLREHRAETARGVLELTELEVRFLRELFESEGRVLSRTELLRRVWQLPPDSETRTPDNFMVRMRKYFEADPSRPLHFETVRGKGYRFTRERGEEEA